VNAFDEARARGEAIARRRPQDVIFAGVSLEVCAASPPTMTGGEPGGDA